MFSYHHHHHNVHFGYDDAKIKNFIYFVASNHRSLSPTLAGGHNGQNSLTS
jgi:hypothetical protein